MVWGTASGKFSCLLINLQTVLDPDWDITDWDTGAFKHKFYLWMSRLPLSVSTFSVQTTFYCEKRFDRGKRTEGITMHQVNIENHLMLMEK